MPGPYDRYPQFPLYYPSPQLHQPQNEGYGPAFPHLQPVSSEFVPQPYSQAEDFSPTLGSAQSNSRARRRIGMAGEYVKHRRTRSGCYTCRNRRVKCDEGRPTCERCRKGNRDCVYPEPNTTSKTKRRDSKTSKSSLGESASSGDEDDENVKIEEGSEALVTQPIKEEKEEHDEPASATSVSAPGTRGSSRVESSTPSASHGKSPTPLTEDSISSGRPTQEPPLGTGPAPDRGAKSVCQSKRWLSLPPDVQFYLNYHRLYVTRFHYAFKYDDDDFLKTKFLEIAIGSEPLMYAVTGFAAYLYAVGRGDGGKVNDFLCYYNKSATALRISISQGGKPNVATLLTILQLATIEEYLGNWVSTLSHQRAAGKLLTALYTPQTVMGTEVSRKLLTWYIRLDLISSMLSGSDITLPREWYQARYDYWLKLSRDGRAELSYLYQERFAYNALVCADAATLWSKKGDAQGNMHDFWAKSSEIERKLKEWEQDLNPTLTDPSKLIKDFSGARPRPENDILDPYEPNFMFGDPLWRTNLMLLDWWSFALMFKHQLCRIRGEEPSEELSAIAWKMLHMFETIELYPDKPAGILVSVHATVGSAAMFMPKDERHSLWVRTKLATVESLGYTFSKNYREKMSEHWGLDLRHWWLANDEGLSKITRTIHSLVIDEGPTIDKVSEDLREMRGIYWKISLDENAITPSTPSSVDSSGKRKERALSLRSSNPDQPYASGNMDVGMDWGMGDQTKAYDESPSLNWGYESKPQSGGMGFQ